MSGLFSAACRSATGIENRFVGGLSKFSLCAELALRVEEILRRHAIRSTQVKLGTFAGDAQILSLHRDVLREPRARLVNR